MTFPTAEREREREMVFLYVGGGGNGGNRNQEEGGSKTREYTIKTSIHFCKPVPEKYFL